MHGIKDAIHHLDQQSNLNTVNLIKQKTFFGLYSSLDRLLTHWKTSPLPGKGYTRQSWPMSGKDSLAFRTYCENGTFRRPPRRTYDVHTWCRAFNIGIISTCFNGRGSNPILLYIYMYALLTEPPWQKNIFLQFAI